jgi:SAM-dependent methyltransferase
MHYVQTDRAEWDYEEFLSSGEGLIAERVDPWLDQIDLDPRLCTAVDIGCGIGRLSRPLSERFGNVIGIDFSPTMVRMATELNAGRPNLRFTVNSGDDLPVAAGSCDFFFSAAVFQHIPRVEIIEHYLSEIRRALSKGGSFVIQAAWPSRAGLYNLLHNVSVDTRLGRIVQRLRDSGPDPIVAAAFPGVFLAPARLARICKASGLAVVEVRADAAPKRTYWAYGRSID